MLFRGRRGGPIATAAAAAAAEGAPKTDRGADRQSRARKAVAETGGARGGGW